MVVDAAGGNILLTTGRTVVGDHAVRIAPRDAVASPAEGSSRILIAAADRIYAEIAGGANNLFAVEKAGGNPQQLPPKADSTADRAVAGDEVLFFTSAEVSAAARLRSMPSPRAGGAVRVVRRAATPRATWRWPATESPSPPTAVSGRRTVTQHESDRQRPARRRG